MDTKKDLFDIFMNETDLFKLYEKIINYIETAIRKAKAEENCKFYEHVIKLENSINNAGCEKRRSEQLDYLWKIQHQIVDEYEDYLP